MAMGVRRSPSRTAGSRARVRAARDCEGEAADDGDAGGRGQGQGKGWVRSPAGGGGCEGGTRF